jgi:RNA polymerase sigma-70 factor (ECF subfamily)
VLFLRRYWFADSVADIARRFGFTESKVKVRLHRTRNELRTFLAKEGISL